GDGVAIEANGLPATSPSKRLTSYPADMISQPLDMRSVTIVATPQAAPVATAVPAAAGAAAAAAAAGVSVVGAAPGGVGGELPAIFQSVGLSPIVLVLSILTALGLGAGHAVSP